MEGVLNMTFEYNGDIMARLKGAGWSEYRIRKEKVLSAATIKAVKDGHPTISISSLDRICHMLGDVSADSVIKYVKPEEIIPKPVSIQEYTNLLMNEWYDNGGSGGPEMSAYITEKLKAKGLI